MIKRRHAVMASILVFSAAAGGALFALENRSFYQKAVPKDLRASYSAALEKGQVSTELRCDVLGHMYDRVRKEATALAGLAAQAKKRCPDMFGSHPA